MHSGFLAVRDELPQNIRARHELDVSDLSDSCRNQIARIDEIWSNSRRTYYEQGPWLLGQFSIADVMYAPVALRFVSYSIPLSPDAQTFLDQILQLESIRDWQRQSAEEPEKLQFIDDLISTSESPLTPG
jgi:glutathione S-transferase